MIIARQTGWLNANVPRAMVIIPKMNTSIGVNIDIFFGLEINPTIPKTIIIIPTMQN